MGQNFMFYRILVWYFVHERRVFHGFAAQILYSPFKLKVNTTNFVPLFAAMILYSPFKLKVNTTDKSDWSDPALIITPFQFKGQYNLNISKDTFVIIRHRPRLFASKSLQFFSIHFPKMASQLSWCYVLIKR